MTEIKKKENSLPLMNEGLGELMCRRHFFIFEGKMYIFPLLAKVTGFENEILDSENPSIKLNVSNAIKGRGGGRQGFDIFP